MLIKSLSRPGRRLPFDSEAVFALVRLPPTFRVNGKSARTSLVGDL
jgi:hypothetical protein